MMMRSPLTDTYRMAFIILLVAGFCASMASAQRPSKGGGFKADLKDQLEVGLRAGRPQDRAFIERVVEMVAADELPLKLVKEMFQWARRKRPYPAVYFERGLRRRAAELDIIIVVAGVAPQSP
jgi:hypothetical protein